MTLLGLQFELCFVAIKAIWIATTIPASMLWSLMMMSNEILQSWVLRLACKTIMHLCRPACIVYPQWVQFMIGTGSMSHSPLPLLFETSPTPHCWCVCVLTDLYIQHNSKQNLKGRHALLHPWPFYTFPGQCLDQWMFCYCPEHIWSRTCNKSKPKPSMHSFYKDALVYLSICIFLHELQVVFESVVFTWYTKLVLDMVMHGLVCARV